MEGATTGDVRSRGRARTVRAAVGVVLALGAGVLVPAAHGTDFGDVQEGGVHRPAIDALDDEKVFGGYGVRPDSFCPADPVPRGVVAVWLARVMDDDPLGARSGKADERDICLDMLSHGGLTRPGQTIIADRRYRRASFENALNEAGITLIRPSTKTEKPRPGRRYLRPFRQIIESVNNTLKTQLDLEQHGGRTKTGVIARVLQRLLALTAAIWYNQTTNQPTPARSFIAYDH